MKILLAVDGSTYSERAAGDVARRPWPADTQVRVISVVEPAAPLLAEPYVGVGSYFEELERVKSKEAHETVARVAEMLRTKAPGLQVSTDVLPGSPRRL